MTLTRPGSSPCPCGGGRYADCCAPFLRREAWPDTAEQLMRSRYTAFALGDTEHLLRTWHPRTRPERLDPDDCTWVRLEVTDTVDGAADDQLGIVGFVAHWRQGREAGRLVERSAFVRKGGRWFYLAATPPAD